MTKREAINNLKNEYDAYYFENKYGTCTHQEEFDLLSTLKGERVDKKLEWALEWIKNCYDCYYKDELEEGNAFDYLESLLGETE